MGVSVSERAGIAPHWGPWLIAGLKAERKRLSRQRYKLMCREAVPPVVRERGAEAMRAILDEIDVQIRGLEYGWDDE
jgi:hypothetical protein